MRTIEEQHVTGEAVKQCEVGAFQWRAVNLVAESVDVLPGLRIDRYDGRRQVPVAARPRGEQRRVALNDLDVQLRAVLTEEAVDRGAVECR